MVGREPSRGGRVSMKRQTQGEKIATMILDSAELDDKPPSTSNPRRPALAPAPETIATGASLPADTILTSSFRSGAPTGAPASSTARGLLTKALAGKAAHDKWRASRNTLCAAGRRGCPDSC